MTDHKGEYKVPGGKLVVARYRLADNRLAQLQLSGDFFLYPDECLELMTAALENSAWDEPDDIWLTRLKAALPPEATLLGVDPAGIVTAIRRGVQRDSQ